jgi:hypothetical protein
MSNATRTSKALRKHTDRNQDVKKIYSTQNARWASASKLGTAIITVPGVEAALSSPKQFI